MTPCIVCPFKYMYSLPVRIALRERDRDRETERYRERKYAKCYISFVKLISRVSVARTFDVNVGNCSWKFLLVCINVAIIVV